MTFVSTRSCTSPVTYIASLPRPTLSPLLNLHIPTLTHHLHSSLPLKPISSNTLINSLKTSSHQKYTYPDPIPEFANAETRKFKGELLRKLSMSKEIGGDVDNVVNVCTEIFSNFLHKEYGGPGTLLVEPFTDMLVALKEKNLPGAPEAARAALLWAQNYLDKDWEVWNSKQSK
ncbi:hypothetical protein ACHQM5_008415 [Ranunculus cassubicifolius]